MIKKTYSQIFTITLLSILVFVGCNSKTEQNVPPVGVSSVPISASDGIISLFDQYQTVALSELHYNQELWSIISEVLKNPKFTQQKIHIALEGGNSLYQDLMDKYTLGENSVTEAEIKKVWRNNTQINTTYDAPVYLNMVNQVREINKTLPNEKKIRVILLDPAIDWDKVKGETDYMPFLMDREPSMSRVIEKEIYAKNTKILFVAGGPHVERSLSSSPVKSALATLEIAHPKTTYTVAFYSGFGLSKDKLNETESMFSAWPKAGIASIKDTDIGKLPAGMNTAAKGPDGTLIDLYPGVQLQQIFDAIIYAGKRDELTTSSPHLNICTGKPEDETWKKTIAERQNLVNTPPFLRTLPENICKPLPQKYFEQDIFK